MIQLFDETSLTPNVWAKGAMTPCHLFNPAITRFRNQLLLLYRVVTPDGRRRLAMCCLTDDLQVVPESVTPFSDFLQAGGGGDWHADGRFCTFGERLFVHYNDGALRGRRGVNQIYLVGGVYGFTAEPPFAPLWLHPSPLLMPPGLLRRWQQLNPIVEYSAYPCGAILQNQHWLVTLGARDEYCCLAQVPQAAIQPQPVRARARPLNFVHGFHG